MPDIEYIEKGTNRVVGRRNAVDDDHKQGDKITINGEKWIITGTGSIGITNKYVVEKAESK